MFYGLTRLWSIIIESEDQFMNSRNLTQETFLSERFLRNSKLRNDIEISESKTKWIVPFHNKEVKTTQNLSMSVFYTDSLFANIIKCY